MPRPSWAQLANVEDASRCDGARQKVHSRSRGAGVEVLELFQRSLLLGRDSGDHGRAEEQGGEAKVELGKAVE